MIEQINFRDYLISINACREAVDFVGDKSFHESWQTCERGDWMLWLAGKLDVDRKLIVWAACQCARLALKHIPASEKRPLLAIEVTERWCAGEATIEDVRAAADVADAASAAAYATADSLRHCAYIVRKEISIEIVIEKLTEAGVKP